MHGGTGLNDKKIDSAGERVESAQLEFRRSLKSRAEGDWEQARLRLLKAAEHMMVAAGLSRGALRQSRRELAEQLLAEAQSTAEGKRPLPRTQQPAPAIKLGDDQQADSWMVRERPNVKFEDIAGLEDVKEQIRIKLLYPFTHPEAASQYGIQPGGGMLLYGPPGTGKTLIARAVAGEINAAFFSITPSEIMSQWVGVAEQNIARLFAEAESHSLSVIFFDEMESLSPKRRASGSTIMVRVVPQLLAELDGFEKRRNPLLLIGATNEPWSLDPAMMRPGRLDRLVYVPPPDTAARQKILEINLKEAPLDVDVALEQIADQTSGFSGADLSELARRTREKVFAGAVHEGIFRPIRRQDLLDVLQDMKPSINPHDLVMYEEFAAGKKAAKS